jgi:nucleoside-diphosphate-sugar epimerase
MMIVITGGAGMIGSHLVDALLGGGHEIVVVDNFLTGRRENLAHLAASPRVQIVEADISTASNLPEAVGPVDRVYHLASPVSSVDYARHPLETLMTNAIGTRNALDVARRWRARFLVTSTSEIYGDPE